MRRVGVEGGLIPVPHFSRKRVDTEYEYEYYYLMSAIPRRCLRCDYEWNQRGNSTPRQCPYCKSPKWAIKRDSPRPGVQGGAVERTVERVFD